MYVSKKMTVSDRVRRENLAAVLRKSKRGKERKIYILRLQNCSLSHQIEYDDYCPAVSILLPPHQKAAKYY